MFFVSAVRAFEIDISASLVDRPGIYAALEVSEVWRFDGESLLIERLGAEGRYSPVEASGWLPIRADEVAPYDPSDQRLEVFPDESSPDQTVTEQLGGAIVTATDYGNPVTYTPDDRPANGIQPSP